MGKIIQIDYDAVDTTAQQLDRQVDQVRQLTASIRLAVSALENGGWEGIAAQAFLSEMECDIIPALNRLSNALDSSRSHVLMTRDRFRSAEEQAARYFMGESQAVAPLRQGRLGEVMTPDWLPGFFGNLNRGRDLARFLGIMTHIRAGGFYGNQIVIRGSRVIRTGLLGLHSGYITHIRADRLVEDLTGIRSNLGRASLIMTGIGLAIDFAQDARVYGPRGPEYVAAAMVADTAQTGLSWVAAAKGAAIGASLGAPAGPVGMVAGGLAGGILAGWAADYVWDTPITTIFRDTSTVAVRSILGAGMVPGILAAPVAARAGDILGGSISRAVFGPQSTDVTIKDYAVEGLVTGGRAVAGVATAIGSSIRTAASQLDRTLAPAITL